MTHLQESMDNNVRIILTTNEKRCKKDTVFVQVIIIKIIYVWGSSEWKILLYITEIKL